jgi:hypothetical protein
MAHRVAPGAANFAPEAVGTDIECLRGAHPAGILRLRTDLRECEFAPPAVTTRGPHAPLLCLTGPTAAEPRMLQRSQTTVDPPFPGRTPHASKSPSVR